MNSESTSRKIKTAVITGHHPFDVPAFYGAFRSMPEIDFYPQHMEEFSISTSVRPGIPRNIALGAAEIR